MGSQTGSWCVRLILETRMSIQAQCWYAAVDWAREKHDVVVTDYEGKRLGRLQVEHSGEGLARMADWLVATTNGTPDAILIAIEVPHGPVVDTLIDRGFSVHSINPKKSTFRARFTSLAQRTTAATAM